MAALDPVLETIRSTYGLAREDFWELPQKKGTWLVKHSALEMVAVKAKIDFEPPQIIQADTGNGIAVLAVTGAVMVDGGVVRAWATGEAGPKNNKNAYPWAMAEKRAKDRVVLKLIGVHGLVYSEDEMDDAASEPAPPPKERGPSKQKAREPYAELQAEIDACQTIDDLGMLWRSKPFQDELKKLPLDWQGQLETRKDERKADLMKPNGHARVAPNFDHMENADG